MFASAKLRISVLVVILTLGASVSGAAAWTKTQEGLGLGTGAIQNPVHPESSADAWKGSYVYYGKYHTDDARLTPLTPVRYRVLDKESSAFGVEGGSLFLDCDNILYRAPFDRSGNKTNVWKDCTERDFLNGKRDAYDGKVFFGREGVFSDAEEAAIAVSKMDRPSDASEINGFVPTGLNEDRIFLLDIADVENPAYGYGTDDSRRKVFTYPNDRDWHSWWLRSPNGTNKACRIRTEGTYFVEGNVNKQDYVGASPAFNVKLSSVIFSSLVNGEAGEPGAEYKLTLKDADMGITADAATQNGNMITVYYTITGAHASNVNRVSMLVTNGTWDEDNGWSDGAEVLQYDTVSGNFSTSGGWGTFNLNSDAISGAEGTYNMYILAEDVNDQNETDYASIPTLITISTVSGGSQDESSAANGSDNGQDESSAATGSDNGQDESSAATGSDNGQDESNAATGSDNGQDESNAATGSDNGQDDSNAANGNAGQDGNAEETGTTARNGDALSGTGNTYNMYNKYNTYNTYNTYNANSTYNTYNVYILPRNVNGQNESGEAANGNNAKKNSDVANGNSAKKSSEVANGNSAQKSNEAANGNIAQKSNDVANGNSAQKSSDAANGNSVQKSNSSANGSSNGQGSNSAANGSSNGQGSNSAANDSNNGQGSNSAANDSNNGQGSNNVATGNESSSWRSNGVEMGSSSQGNIGMGAGGGCDAGLGGMSLGLVGIFMAARKGKKQ